MQQELLHEQEIDIADVGITMRIGGNLLSKCVYRYNCIRSTSLGDYMLGALLSTWIRNNLKRLELFDYLMHYIGCPAAVICLAVLPQLKAITEIGGLSTLIWAVILLALTLHYINVIFALVFIMWPMQAAMSVVLIFPIDTHDSIGDSLNKFFEFTSRERLTYRASDSQSSLIIQAIGKEGKIKIMVYNNTWNRRYKSITAYINCFSHLIATLVIIILFNARKEVIIVAYACFYIVYWLTICVCKDDNGNENGFSMCSFGIVECVGHIACCPCIFCSPYNHAFLLEKVKVGMEQNTLQPAEKLRPIESVFPWWL